MHKVSFERADRNGDGVVDESEFEKHVDLMKVQHYTSYLHVFIFLAFLYFISLANVPAVTEACNFMIGFSIVMILCVLVLSRETLVHISRITAVV